MIIAMHSLLSKHLIINRTSIIGQTLKRYYIKTFNSSDCKLQSLNTRFQYQYRARTAINLNKNNEENGKRSIRTTSYNKFPIENYSPYDYTDGIIYAIRRRIGLTSVPKYRLRESSVFLYESCTDAIPIENFFNYCELPDTYLSWFLVTQLHVWMCMTRGMIEGKEGRVLRNEMVARMWDDSQARLKKLIHLPASDQRKGMEDLLHQFQAALFSYDEGLLTDDKTLAAALWRTLFVYQSVNPQILETMVSYVRTQLFHLTTIPSEQFLLDGKIAWKQFPPLYP